MSTALLACVGAGWIAACGGGDQTSDGGSEAGTDAHADAPAGNDANGGDANGDAGGDANKIDASGDAVASDSGGDAIADAQGGDGGSVCGDGVVTNPEVCDDYNNSSCGTCGANCSVSQPLTAATGTITAVSGQSLVDGETFTISDGTQTSTVFEFDSNNSVTSGHVQVLFTLNSNATLMATAMRTAINGVGGSLLVTASGTGSTVNLTNDQQGSLGNVALTETVANSGFAVSGMSGGLGADCSSGTNCGVTADCQLGLTCSNHKCQ